MKHSLLILKPNFPGFLFLVFLTILSFSLHSQNPGDIIFTGYNSDGPDEFSFMATKSIPGNAQIHFTDNGWTTAGGGAFTTNEGELLYTTPSPGLRQGEQVVIQASGSSPLVVNGSGTVVQVGSNKIVFTAFGDGIIAFSGTLNNPLPLAAITTDASGWTNPTATTQTNIPNGLVVGQTAFLLLENGTTESDNWIYNCDTLYGDLSDIQSAVGSLGNWTSDNDNTFNLPCSPIVSTWNGTWSPSEPSAQNDLIIDSPNSINSDIICRDLTINTAQSLNLGTNSLSISGNIVNNGNGIQSTGIINFSGNDSTLAINGNTLFLTNSIIVDSACSLNANSKLVLSATSQDTFGQISGKGEVLNLIVQKYIDPTSPKYFYLGLPLQNALLDEFNEGNILQSSNSSQGNIWEWDASISQWKEPGNVASTNSIPAKAYALYAGTNSSGTFVLGNPGPLNYSGSPNMEVVPIALDYNDGQSSGSQSFVGGSSLAHTQGWNLVSNPYPCYYDWDQQNLPVDLGTAIYRFDGSSYTSYLKGAGSGSRFILPGEGFFVQLQANSPGNLSFDPANRNPSKIISSAKRSSTFDGLKITAFNSTTQLKDEVYLGFDSLASANFDPEYDAWKLMNEGKSPNLYCEMTDGPYSIMRFDLKLTPYIIPLAFYQELDGDSIRLQLDLSSLKSNVKILIEDLKTGQFHNPVINDLLFKYDLNFRKDRFRIHIEKSTISLKEEEIEEGNWFISQNSSGITLHLKDEYEASSTASVFNLKGREICKIDLKQKDNHIPLLNAGIYIVRLEKEKTFSQSKKVFFLKN